MPLAREPLLLFATLLLLWLVLNGSPAPDVIGVGVITVGFVAYLFRGLPSILAGHRLDGQGLLATLGFFGYFLRALVKANVEMAAIVLHPELPIRPAFVRVQTRLTHPVARLILANAITLTPGTLSVDIEGDTLLVHWVVADSTDPAVATAEIVSGFESYLERMYA